MNIQDVILEGIRSSVANVFSTMLGVELSAGDPCVEQGLPEVNDGVVSFIGLAGAWAGTGSLICSPSVACRICSLMLMTETSSVDADVLDAVAELTNMVIGSVKNDLEPHVGPLGLSIPTVVFGKNFKTRTASSAEWMVVRFPWEGEFLTVKLFLAPSERVPHAASQLMGQTCPIEV